MSRNTASGWVGCGVAGKEWRVGAGVTSRPPIQASSGRGISILPMHMVKNIKVVIRLRDDMRRVARGLRKDVSDGLGEYVSRMGCRLGEYMGCRLGEYVGCVPCMGVGLGSTCLLSHIEVGISAILSHQKTALGNLCPGSISKECGGVSCDDGQKYRADRECV